jgi:site-specific recombinase XerD
VLVERATARNRAMLWVLFDTGMRVSEVCALCLGDVDRERGILRVQGKSRKERWLMLGHEGQRHLLTYLDDYRLGAASGEWANVSEKHLFLSETGRPLTKNGIAHLFGRLRKRAEITRKGITTALLRESFAVRYLRAGGDLDTLQELLGQQGSLLWHHAQRRWEQMKDDQWAGESPERGL